MMNGLTFNGGMFGVVIGFTRLYQHRQAAQLQVGFVFTQPVDHAQLQLFSLVLQARVSLH